MDVRSLCTRTHFHFDTVFVINVASIHVIIPATGHSSDLWKRELQKDLLLFIHKVNPRPVHCHDHVVLGQTRPCGQTDTFTTSKVAHTEIQNV